MYVLKSIYHNSSFLRLGQVRKCVVEVVVVLVCGMVPFYRSGMSLVFVPFIELLTYFRGMLIVEDF